MQIHLDYKETKSRKQKHKCYVNIISNVNILFFSFP